MKMGKLILGATFLLGLASCAHHQMMRGSVAMKVSDQRAHVCLGDNEVKVGDRITAYKNECRESKALVERGVLKAACRFVKLGEGKVVELLNEHYSTVEFDPGVPFKEGTVVQKE